MKTPTLLLPLSLLALSTAARADDWPQWQGPDRTNVSRETGLLKKWPESGPKLLWTFSDAGVGYSGPAIVGDHLYTLGAQGDTEYLFALDVKSARKLWSCPVGPLFNNGWGNGPRSTPTVDGDLVYALGGQGNLVCARVANGDLVWRKSLKTDLGGVMMSGWGYSESPLVDGEQVVCTPGGRQGAVAALDKKTGEVLWRSKEFTDPAAYSSLVVSEAGGVRQYVQMTGQSVAGLAPRDGRLLWRFARTSRTAAIPTPIVFEDYVYVTSGYGAGCALLKLSANGNGKVQCEEVYDNKLVSNHHGGVVLVKGHIYGHSGARGWICQDFLSGKIVWRSNRLGKGSLTCADGYLYCYDEDEGTVALVQASPKGWLESGRFTIPETSKLPRPPNRRSSNFWTHPVVANGRLYVRDQEMIFCYDVSARD